MLMFQLLVYTYNYDVTIDNVIEIIAFSPSLKSLKLNEWIHCEEEDYELDN